MPVFDAFPFHDELDILECRLVELENVPDVVHVLVEATVTHQDRPKPLHFAENRDRFAKWSDRIVHVVADRLPTVADDPDPWARELAQREWILAGLHQAGATDGDVLLQSDVDEIPHPLVVRNVRPHGGPVAFQQRGHFWAVDWLYPEPWMGTVATYVGDIPSLGPSPMGRMRSLRNLVKSLPNAGWHLSWLGGRERAMHKVGSFCHPEVEDRIVRGLDDDTFLRHGWHVDGKRMLPVDVNRTWPRWIWEGHAPASWYRPR